MAANQGWVLPYVIFLDDADVSMERTIIAFHDGGEAVVCGNSQVTFSCCDLHGNGSNEICGEDLGGNFSADPLFCDMDSDDYSLDADSPCLPGNHPDGIECGLVGARGLGCGVPTATGACCFVDGSCAVLFQDDCLEARGTYLGDGTNCEPNPCDPVPVEPTTWGRVKATYR